MINPNPRKFRKVNKQLIKKTYEGKSNRLCFGLYGIQSTEMGFLTVRQIEAVRRIISSHLKHKGKVWIRAFPDYPRTAKPKEVRMGRGKGNVDHWVCMVKPGRVLFEVYSTESILVNEVLSMVKEKLPFFAQIITRNLKI